MTSKNTSTEHSAECSAPLDQHTSVQTDPSNTPTGAGQNSQPTTPSPDSSQAPAKKKSTAKKKRSSPAHAGKSVKKPSAQKKKSKTRKKKNRYPLTLRLLLNALEICALAGAGLIAVLIILGYGAEYLSGTSLLYNRLPFTLSVLVTIVAAVVILRGWSWLRTVLARWHITLAPFLALILALSAVFLVQKQYFERPLEQFRILIGGKAEIRTVTLRHQIFAAYRRLDAKEMEKMLLRAQVYAADIEEAARIFAIDPDLLKGLAAAESSFYPRPSADGGQGLFQITSIPSQAQAQALQHLNSTTADMNNHRHNTFAAAATLRYYLGQMNGNMVLGLLAYNIGPANGGLRFIMQRYSATDFISIQPYLQEKPRNYPVRVLAYALAFRIHRQEQRLLPYEEGLNATRIQHIGIPGL